MKATREPPKPRLHRFNFVVILGVGCMVLGCGGPAPNMHEAIQDGDVLRVRALIEADAESVNTRDKEGMYPLHWAAIWEKKEITELLLKHHADVNAKSRLGKTPLHLAATAGNEAAVELLLANGADVHAKANAGQTPLHSVVALGPQFMPSTNVVVLLLAKGANVNARDNRGWTPLCWAAVLHHADAVVFLEANGADFDIFSAAALGDADRLAALLKTNPNLVSTTNSTGLTPLHMAAIAGSKTTATILLNEGADVDAKDRDGRTPLQETMDRGHVEVARTLLTHHALVDGNMASQYTAANGHAEIAKLLDEFRPDE